MMTITKTAHGVAVLVKVCGMVQLAAIATGQVLSLLKKKWMTAMTLTNWPFPPATGAVPWTAKQEQAYQQAQRAQLPESPL